MNAPQSVDYNDPQTLKRVASDMINLGMQHGDVEVAVSAGEGLAITVRGGAVETLESERDKSLAVTVYQDGRKGSATTSDFSAAALKETVAAATEIAASGEIDQYAGLADVADLAAQVPALELDYPWDLEPEQAIELALRCEAAALGADNRIKQSDGASVNRYRGTRAYANSAGFCEAYRGTRHSISAIMIAEQDDAMQRGYWYESARSADDLGAAEMIGQRAAERTVAKLGARKLATTSMPVIFEARAASGLVGHMISAISGAAQYRKASFLLDAVGEQVLPENLSLVEKPHLARAIGSAPFDSDGIATREKTIVENGQLRTYLLSAYAARRLQLAPTGNAGGTHNLILTPGDRDLAAMIAGQKRALLVTDLMGFGVNGVTGDYSRGASGFYLENGEVAHAVEEITIAGNLRDMLLGIDEVGNDVDAGLNIRCGSVLLGEMAIAGS